MFCHIVNEHLLYKHQWNTKWAFPRKLHIFTREDNMLSSHAKRSSSLWLHNKSRLFHRSWSCVYIINRILHVRLWIWILSSRVEHSKIKFISTRGHVISSIYCIELPVTFLSFACLFFGILGFKSEQYFGKLDFCIFNLRRRRGLFYYPWLSVFASIKYIFFESCLASTGLLRIELSWY